MSPDGGRADHPGREPADRPGPESRDGPDMESGPDGEPAQERGEYVCDICGAAMLERHCKILCPVCGYQRDCSDP